MLFTFEMFITLSIMIFAIIGYSTRKFPVDAVSISVLGLLFLIFEIYPVDGINFDDFITGFSNQGLLTVMALLVVAQGVYSTGILNTFVDNIMHLNRDLQTSKNTLLILLLFMMLEITATINNSKIKSVFLLVCKSLFKCIILSTKVFSIPVE